MPHPGLLPTYSLFLTFGHYSLLSMMKALLASVIRLSLTFPHISEKARMNIHQASYLVSIRLIFVFYFIWAESRLLYWYFFAPLAKSVWKVYHKCWPIQFNTSFWKLSLFDVQQVELVCICICFQLSIFPKKTTTGCHLKLKIGMFYHMNNTFCHDAF